MQIDIESPNVPMSMTAKSRIVRRVQRALQRLSDRVNRLQIYIRDTNGAKGGKDKLCRIQANLCNGGQIIISQESHSVPQAIFHALRRLKRILVNRTLRRRSAGGCFSAQ